MSKADAFPRRRPSTWSPRDILLVAAALVLLIGITVAVAFKSQWTPLLGANVAPIPIATLATSDLHSLAFDPRDPDIVYFGHHQGVLKSVDGGVNWLPVLRQGDAMGLVAVDNALIVAGHKVFMQSDSAGAMWKFIGTNLPDEDIHGFAVSPSNPKTFFALIVSYGLWQSEDSGATWTLVSKELPDSVLALAVVPDSPETLYAGTMDKSLLKSVDGGKTWKPAPGYGAKMAMALAQDPRDPRVVLAATKSGLLRSNPEGNDWRSVGLNGKDLMAVAVSSANPARILVVDAQGRVYRSDDSGATWQR